MNVKYDFGNQVISPKERTLKITVLVVFDFWNNLRHLFVLCASNFLRTKFIRHSSYWHKFKMWSATAFKFLLRLSSLSFLKIQGLGVLYILWFNYYLLLKLQTLCPTTEISKEIRLIVWKRICKSKVTIAKELNNAFAGGTEPLPQN